MDENNVKGYNDSRIGIEEKINIGEGEEISLRRQFKKIRLYKNKQW